MANSIPDEHKMYRTGGWLPQDHRVQAQWFADTIAHVENNPKDYHPIIREFKDLIESETRLYIMFSSMFEELPKKKPYTSNPAGHRQVRDYEHMLQLLNHLIGVPPGWSEHEFGAGLVGLPLQALYDWPMGTPSGFAVFLDPAVNAVLKKVLNVWGTYLQSPDSAKCLNDGPNGWFGRNATTHLRTVANEAAGTNHSSFEEMFICDPSSQYHGFKSWDDFFTRQFREGIRPVAAPDKDEVIANCCESTPFKVSRNVAAREHFWLKGQPYSVLDMLAKCHFAEQFVGGTVYQAFLSALSYHRWHSPVSGKVVKRYVVDGTYYSEPLFTTMADPQSIGSGGHPDPEGQATGQSYIAHTATRGLIFIEADNPDVGLMCVVQVGMVEVSSCDITVKEGQHIKKGDQLGMVSFETLCGSAPCFNCLH